eukprot:scaffold72429_cov47-Prasinocladus_malaysianus.AAC.1
MTLLMKTMKVTKVIKNNNDSNGSWAGFSFGRDCVRFEVRVVVIITPAFAPLPPSSSPSIIMRVYLCCSCMTNIAKAWPQSYHFTSACFHPRFRSVSSSPLHSKTIMAIILLGPLHIIEPCPCPLALDSSLARVNLNISAPSEKYGLLYLTVPGASSQGGSFCRRREAPQALPAQTKVRLHGPADNCRQRFLSRHQRYISSLNDLVTCRWIKSQPEVQLMRESAELAASAIKKCMALTRRTPSEAFLAATF